jgi:hypothetical protein
MREPNDKQTRPLVNRLVSLQLPLTGPQKLVLICLVDHWNPKNGTKVWPGVPRLADMTGFSESTVRRCLRELKDMGMVTIEEQPGSYNLYYLNIEMLQNMGCQPDRGNGLGGVTLTSHPCHSDKAPLSERQGTPVTVNAEQSKEQSKGTGNLTGSEKNRQNGLKHIGQVLDNIGESE